jgi:cytochrome P450
METSAGTPSAQEQVERLFGLDQDLLNDPYPVYAAMRAEQPVMRLGPIVVVSRYDDVKAVLRDPATFSSIRASGSRDLARAAELSPDDAAKFHELTNFEGRGMANLDEPEHARIRRFVNSTFTSGSINQLRDDVEQIVTSLLDEIDARGQQEFDLIGEFSYPLPFKIICGLLGVDDSEIEMLRGWAGEIRRGIGTSYANLPEAYAATMAYRDFIGKIVRAHRQDPSGSTSLVAQLVAPGEDGTMLEDADLESLFIQLMTSGNTNDLIANALIALQANPEQAAILRDDPTKVRAAVEEFFRYCPSIHMIHRVATQDTEIGGFPVAAGETIRLLLASANHDPAKFEDPETMDVTRKNARQHLGLGFGIHTCLGQWLSRQEAELAVIAILERYPSFRITGPVNYRKNMNLHGPDELLVSV